MEFQFDRNKIPAVVRKGDYFAVDSWTFSDQPDDTGDVVRTLQDIYAWIAWYEFLTNEGNDG